VGLTGVAAHRRFSGSDKLFILHMLDFIKDLHDALHTESTAVFVLVAAILFALFGGTMAWILDRKHKNSAAEALASEAGKRQLSVEWNLASPPILPPEGRARVLDLYELPESNGGGGLSEISGKPGTDFAGKTFENVPRFTRQYRITNYSPSTMFNVSITLRLTFREATWNKNEGRSDEVKIDRGWEITLPKIDPGPDRAFIFYAMNSGHCFVSVAFPDTATAQIAGADSRQTVKLITPGRDYFFFSPTIR